MDCSVQICAKFKTYKHDYQKTSVVSVDFNSSALVSSVCLYGCSDEEIISRGRAGGFLVVGKAVAFWKQC
jgi:hypothetical protein